MLVDDRDRRPIRQIEVLAHDGRVLSKNDLMWVLPEDVARDVEAAE